MAAWREKMRLGVGLPTGFSCIVAPLRIASLIAVLRSEWMPIPRPPSRFGSIPAALQYFLTSRQGVLRSRWRRISRSASGVIGRNSGPSLSSLIPARST